MFGDELGRGKCQTRWTPRQRGQFSNGELFDELPGTIPEPIYDEDCV